MRKFLIPMALAIMVFATAAFAASFTINDSILASGQAGVEACSDELEVISWGAEVDDLTASWVVFDREDFGDCGEDEVIFVQVHDDDGNEVGRSGETRVDETFISDTRARVSFQSPVPIADIYEIRAVVHTKTG